MVLGPEMEGLSFLLAVNLRLAMDREGVDVEGRANRLEAVFGDLRIRQLVAQQIEQQCRDQRAVDDQPWIAFNLRHIAAVVMDTMAVESQRRISEQQDIVGNPAFLPLRSFRSGNRRRGDLVGLYCFTVD